MNELKIIQGSGVPTIREGSYGELRRKTLCFHYCLGCKDGHDWSHVREQGENCARPYYEPCEEGKRHAAA